MTTYRWAGTSSGVFGNAANWINDTTHSPNDGVPGALDTVDLIGSGIITGTGTVAAIDVVAFGHGFTLEGTFASQTISVNAALDIATGSVQASSVKIGTPTEAATLTIGHASLAALGAGLAIAVDGRSTLNVAGGTVRLGNGAIILGGFPGGSGTLLDAGDIEGGAGSSIVLGENGGVASADASGGTLVLGGGGGRALVLGAGGLVQDTKSNATLTANGGSITLNGLAVVGAGGTGVAQLANDTLNTGGGLLIGAQASAFGSVALTDVTWTDKGNVVVGGKGTGSLALVQFGTGTDAIDGAVQVGLGAGSGTLTSDGGTIKVSGRTVLAGSANSSITLTDTVWTAAGQTVTLLDSTTVMGSTLSLTGQHSVLMAGTLDVGMNDVVSAVQGAQIALGNSGAAGDGLISGELVLDNGSQLVSSGRLVVSHAQFDQGLVLVSSGATLTASSGYALSLVNNGFASLAGNVPLAVTGGLYVGNTSDLTLSSGGTVTVQSDHGPALLLADGGQVQDFSAGTLTTKGLCLIGNGKFGESGQATKLFVSNGNVVDSIANAPGGLAVLFDDGTATLVASQWNIAGHADLGVSTGDFGSLTITLSTVRISGALNVGAPESSGAIFAGSTDTIVSGSTLAAGQTGLSAASIAVRGAGSSINAGALVVGSAQHQGGISISGGSVDLTGGATIDGAVRLAQGGLLLADSISLSATSFVSGSGTLHTLGDIIDDGRIIAQNSRIACLGTITGTGHLNVSDGTLILADTEAASVGITFGATGTIVTPSVADIAGTISGWQAGDAIDFTGALIASDSYSGGTLSLFDSAGGLIGTEHFASGLTANNFMLTSDQGTGTILGYHG